MDSLRQLNPLASLRVRLGLLVFAAIGALTVFMTLVFSERLTEAYQHAGRAQLHAVADTFADGIKRSDLSDPDALQRRVNALQANNETLHKISVSWHDRKGATLLVQAGHEHDPDGTKRDVSTSEALTLAADSRPAPIDARSYGQREVRATDGAHYAELERPLRSGGRTIAALELHYDLAGLDSALGRDKRTVGVVGVLSGLTLMLLLSLILGRTVLSPLGRMQEAARKIGRGATDTRLNWRRSDEIGLLAADFDRMAEELQAVHGHLEVMALKDPLSGLLNHRAFKERLTQELRRAEREGYSVAVVAIDVDHFKEVNDRWGHVAGDNALKVLGTAIRSQLRPSDICGRVGGDEFMLGIVRSDVENAQSVVDRLREKIADTEFGPAGQTITISAGISEFPRHSLSREELMHLADGAMYWAKSSGRNRSYIYSSETDFELAAERTADRVMRSGLVNTVHALAKAVDAKDGYTHSHSQRVARYAASLAKAIGMDANGIEQVRTAGVLHDVGKIGISDVVLLKPGRLTEEEQETMRRHSELGREIIAGAGMDEIARYVMHLHERWDGTGYPDGIAAEDIPLESRVLHVADALEAMTSSRVYRTALPLDEALAELERGAGTQFDPAVAARMVELVRSGQVEIASEEAPDECGAEPVPTAVVAAATEAANGGPPEPQSATDAHASGA
jgi:diguanylate cyclase (GGDEF)-like protein/putative nucleotidyltransferase with HDIG domain